MGRSGESGISLVLWPWLGSIACFPLSPFSRESRSTVGCLGQSFGSVFVSNGSPLVGLGVGFRQAPRRQREEKGGLPHQSEPLMQ